MIGEKQKLSVASSCLMSTYCLHKSMNWDILPFISSSAKQNLCYIFFCFYICSIHLHVHVYLLTCSYSFRLTFKNCEYAGLYIIATMHRACACFKNQFFCYIYTAALFLQYKPLSFSLLSNMPVHASTCITCHVELPVV